MEKENDMAGKGSNRRKQDSEKVRQGLSQVLSKTKMELWLEQKEKEENELGNTKAN